MFDPVGTFSRQFTPIKGGYVYYPSRKAGGKLVTVEEYEGLLADWRSVAGGRGQWKTVGIAFLAILLWTVASEALALPAWADWIIVTACVAVLSGWLFGPPSRRAVLLETDPTSLRRAPLCRHGEKLAPH